MLMVQVLISLGGLSASERLGQSTDKTQNELLGRFAVSPAYVLWVPFNHALQPALCCSWHFCWNWGCPSGPTALRFDDEE